MIGIKVITVVNTTVAGILAKPTACKYEVVNFLGNLIWWAPCYSAVLFIWKQGVQQINSGYWNISSLQDFQMFYFLEEKNYTK